MYLISKIYCTPDMEVQSIVKENPLIHLVLENFGIPDFEKNVTVKELCALNNLNENLFLSICNLHNGFYINNVLNISYSDIKDIINYLKRSHAYYLKEKYPEIQNYIHEISLTENSQILSIIETYFQEYFQEVKEHIEYEENIAFPYFFELLNPSADQKVRYSSNDYREHHTDIESRLNALKDLFIQHVHLTNKKELKRKVLMSLSELEFELRIHSHIEDMILIPLTKQLESNNSNE